MRKFIEKRVRYYDDGDTSEMWIAGFHDPTLPVSVDAQDPAFVTSSERSSFDRSEAHGKSFEALIMDGIHEGEFGPRDELKFQEVCDISLDLNEDRLANSPPPMAEGEK